MRRLSYILSIIGMYVVLGLVLVYAFSQMSIDSTRQTGEAFAAQVGITVLAAVILFLIAALVLAVLRFRNQGSSGWMALLFIVPVANLWAMWRLVACQEGYKDVGHLDRAGKIITWVYVGLIVLSFVGNIITETSTNSGY
ncbi:MAG: hypothetical protein AAGA58_11005 [Verrucomicrobiota bacterium]